MIGRATIRDYRSYNEALRPEQNLDNPAVKVGVRGNPQTREPIAAETRQSLK